MLTGRESLSRLIGKRRRFLPNRDSIISSQDYLGLYERNEAKEKEEIVNRLETSRQNVVSEPDWVNCPVCGIKVRGDNNSINSHLDACLSKGTKRKFNQCTLFQLNFCSKRKVEIHQVNADDCNDISELKDSDAVGETNGEELKTRTDMETGGSINSDMVHDSVHPHSVRIDLPKYDMTEPVVDCDSNFESSIQTFIVGRRFVEDVELGSGGKIFLLRDPSNVKDHNALKVVSAESDGGKPLGFLPRELAQYLSPLMDKFQLGFEGHIADVPSGSRAIVPIELTVQSKEFLTDKKLEDLQLMQTFWRHALDVVESTKSHPFGTTKYQLNLTLLIQGVLNSSSHLLIDDEKASLEAFTSLSDDSQRLFSRLYTRKGPWFKVSSISYTEILDLEEAIKGLSAAGYIHLLASSEGLQQDILMEILNLLNVSDLQEILCLLKKISALPDKMSHRGTRKQDVIAKVLSSYKAGLCADLPDMVLEKTGACISISAPAESLLWRAERLFFLNGEQDLSAFLLVDLGVIKYPTYNCLFTNQIFSTREEMISYEEAIEVAQVMDESLDQNNTELVLRCIEISDSSIAESSPSHATPTFESRFSAHYVYSKVVLLGISFLEHERRYREAITLLRKLLSFFPSDGRRGYWTLRLSLDLEHVGCPNESLQVAEDALLDPWVRSGSRMALQRRVLRLSKPPRRWKTPTFSQSLKRKIAEVNVQGRPLNCKTGLKSIFYNEDGEQCGVEQLALQYYAGEGGGWQGVHTESGIWLTIFGILMWDVMFADIPNVFRTQFQTAPLDLDTDWFYEARKSLIEELLGRIHDGMAEEILITSWESHVGTACRGVSWDKHSLSELRSAVACIGGPCLASICRHLAQDYRSWTSGMPDLLLWRFHDNYVGEAKLVEVKGPSDRLSEQQRAWLLVLMDSGFKVEVCKISPP
ncbi:hypothetical protein LIER_12441 [Lithospermum erythrorhizon]|uniref:Fanconi-associated nuclease n=1 Tax=Lithospermum erythrorhizon TaxID=34254 RepID=A0AAV3PRW6_LITER